ncbi:MAG: hypothetical protein ABSE73_21135 [Planctomycetota bacterium]
MKPVQAQLTGSKGVSLLETMIAGVVLAIGICGVMTSLTSTRQYLDYDREENLAINEARLRLAQLEALQSPTSFTTIFTTYNNVTNALTTTDANLTLYGGTATFYFPTDTTGTKLVETLPAPVSGTNLAFQGLMANGLDLNGDGTIDGATVDHSSDPKLLMLPVLIRVQWTSMKTQVQRNLDFLSILYPRHQ